MRMAALDVGDVRIGVAVSDELGLTVRGIATIRRVGGQRDLEAIARTLRPLAPERVVVGLPFNMDGTEGPQAARVRRFVAKLEPHLGVPVVLWDERLTSVAAEEALRAAGLRRDKRRALIDQEAAAVILESYLARTP
jgi:putative Holliday junction resolvase